MVQLLNHISFVLTLLFVANVRPAPAPPKRAPTRLVYQLPNHTWIENLAVRSNGHLILTSTEYPGQVLSLDPLAEKPELVQIAATPPWNSTLGIVEAEHDVFYLIASDVNLAAVSARTGSNTIWRLDFRSHSTYRHDGGGSKPKAEQMVSMREAQFLNGLTAFNSTLLLAADSRLGLVWGIDTQTGTYWKVAGDAIMKSPADAPIQEGINGLHVYQSRNGKGDRTLYFTSSERFVYSSILLNPNAEPIGPAKVIAHPKPEQGLTDIDWDDFALDADGNAYIATEIGNTIQRVTPDGRVDIVAGALNSTALAEPSAANFGRTEQDSHILYVTTTGGFGFPVMTRDGPVQIGAQVVAVDLSAWLCRT